MRPPMATDHRPAARRRIRYIQKHAPYNSGEERVVDENVARRLCIMGVAIPAAKRPFLRDAQGLEIEDTLGGWSVTGAEKAATIKRQVDAKEASGDFAGEVEDEEVAREAEEARVEAEATPKKKAPRKKRSGFSRKGKAKAEPQGEPDGEPAE